MENNTNHRGGETVITSHRNLLKFTYSRVGCDNRFFYHF